MKIILNKNINSFSLKVVIEEMASFFFKGFLVDEIFELNCKVEELGKQQAIVFPDLASKTDMLINQLRIFKRFKLASKIH